MKTKIGNKVGRAKNKQMRSSRRFATGTFRTAAGELTAKLSPSVATDLKSATSRCIWTGNEFVSARTRKAPHLVDLLNLPENPAVLWNHFEPELPCRNISPFRWPASPRRIPYATRASYPHMTSLIDLRQLTQTGNIQRDYKDEPVIISPGKPSHFRSIFVAER